MFVAGVISSSKNDAASVFSTPYPEHNPNSFFQVLGLIAREKLKLRAGTVKVRIAVEITLNEVRQIT